jgi:hypothetical protein
VNIIRRIVASGSSKWADAIIKAIEDIELDLGANRAHRLEIHDWMKKNKSRLWGSQKHPDKTIQAYLQQEHYGFKSVFGKEARKGYYTLLDSQLHPAPISPPTAPGSNTGHSAEMRVGEFLKNAGWVVSWVARMSYGYDLEAVRTTTTGAMETRRIEVKSSLGRCNPVFTQNEWVMAEEFGSEYWLAIVPNFSSTSKVAPTIHWIQDPFKNLKPKQSSIKQYRINSADWKSCSGGFRP